MPYNRANSYLFVNGIEIIKFKAKDRMTLTKETRHIEWHKFCKCISRLDKIICNSTQRCNKDKCRCECKELIDKGVCCM